MSSSTITTTPNITHPKEAKGVIFDIDGTLADSWKLGFDATQVVLKNNQIDTITEELYHDCTRFSTPDRLARHAGFLPPNNDDENEVSEYEKVGQKLAKEFDELYVGLVSLDTAGFYDGIAHLIVNLPSSASTSSSSVTDGGVKVGALTNACVAYAHAVLKVNCPIYSTKSTDDINTPSEDCIYTKFESIHGADTVPHPKPKPDGLYQCCTELNVNPNDCVYIGDSPSDAVAAKSAGMLAIGVLWGSHGRSVVESAPFDFVCETVDELTGLLLPSSSSSVS